MKKEEYTNKISDSIVKIVTYSDFFDYPLRLSEIHNDLPLMEASHDQTSHALSILNGEAGVIGEKDGFYFPHGRTRIVDLRNRRIKSTSSLIRKHETGLRRLYNIPWVRTVAITGSAAFDNSDESDDIDVFLIVSANRAWIVDLYNLFILRLFNERILKKSKSICMNYIIDEASLVLLERDFFTAHQCAHMKPIYDEGLWDTFINSNKWIKNYFPNVKTAKIDISPKPRFKRYLETISNIFAAGFLNAMLYAIRGKRLQRKKIRGLIKGDYSLRRLKCNDSRSGAIVDLRLKQSVSDPDGSILMRDILTDSEYVPGRIPDYIPDSKKPEIESLLDHFQNSKLKRDESISDDDLMKLPLVSAGSKHSYVWNRRARHFQMIMGILRSSPSHSNELVLDLGSGNCWLSRHLIENGYETVSLDPMLESDWGLSKGDVIEKNSWVKLRRVRGIMEHLPFKDKSFKSVISSGSIHYTCDLKATIEEISRVLTDDGIAMICDTPVFQNESDGEKMISAMKSKFDPNNKLEQIKTQPIWFIDLNSLREIASSAGLNISVIPTRSSAQKTFDRIKNILTDDRRWAEMPLIILSKRKPEPAYKRQSLLRRLRYYHYRLFIEPKLIPHIEFKIDGMKFKVDTGVFHPIPYDSSRILLDFIKKSHADLKNKSVLDMGTGSGIHSIHCARKGADVIAVDINPDAISNASQNAFRNNVDSKFWFIESDLFSNLGDKEFDLILFNPPFYDSKTPDSADHAWYDENNRSIHNFIHALPSYLAENGKALIILSDCMNLSRIEKWCIEMGLVFEVRLTRRCWDETYKIYEIKQSKQ